MGLGLGLGLVSMSTNQANSFEVAPSGRSAEGNFGS